MADTWNVTAAYDKASYNKGDTIKITITGGLTSSGSDQPGTLTQTIKANDGATTTITMPITVTGGTTTTTPGKITNVADTSARAWTIAADGLSVTAIA